MILKAKSARAQDEADSVRLFIRRDLSADDIERVKQKVDDLELRDMVDR